MKRPLIFLWVLGGLALMAGVIHAAEQLYTCGMHPQIIRREPGTCPICGMNLTPVRNNMGDAGSAHIHVDTGTVQRMNLKTALVETGPVFREIRAVGSVAFDESTRRDVTLRYEGWIEKLHVDRAGVVVEAGAPLFDVYSPELYNAQFNLLVARRSEGEAGGPLTRAATERLRLFGLSDEAVAAVLHADSPSRTFTFHAPTAGTVLEKLVVEGQMVPAGSVIYRLADLSKVWVLAQIYESDLPFVQVGTHADVRATFGPSRSFSGAVGLVLPEITADTRTATARIVVENPDGFLRPGMFVDVRLHTQLADAAVLVPDMAVLRSGERNTVFVALDGGMFEPREITLGARTNDYRYEVLAGLSAGERVVTSGQFMLDSEAQLREGIQKMMRAEGAAAPAEAPMPGAGHVH